MHPDRRRVDHLRIAVIGLRYGVESHEAGSTLIVSTILSALTLAAALILAAAN